MAHPEQQQFMLSVKSKFPEKFTNVRVLDVGSLDINGNNRYLFDEKSKYLGIDVGLGKNVDIVCRGHEFIDYHGFDTIVSTECFEHDEFWKKTIANIIKLLRPSGLFAFTCASDGRQEHGTKRTTPQDSPFTSLINDYYHNLTEKELMENFDLDSLFEQFEVKQVTNWPQDLYFWGIKK